MSGSYGPTVGRLLRLVIVEPSGLAGVPPWRVCVLDGGMLTMEVSCDSLAEAEELSRRLTDRRVLL